MGKAKLPSSLKLCRATRLFMSPTTDRSGEENAKLSFLLVLFKKEKTVYYVLVQLFKCAKVIFS